MVTSKFKSNRTTSQEEFEKSLETLKKLSTDKQGVDSIDASEPSLSWEDAVSDIETYLQQTETFSN